MSEDSLQGECADVRHSTHTGHSTDRPSRARVAESCWSFNGITSSTCRKHLGAWQAAAHAWRASAIGGLTSPGRAVRCATDMWRLCKRQNANFIACWVAYPFVWVQWAELWPKAS